MSRATHFGIVEMIKYKRRETIMKSLQQVIDTNHGREFKSRHILEDRQSESIGKSLEKIGFCEYNRT